MAYINHVSERLTHKYRSGWADLDKWGRPHEVKVLAPRIVEESSGFDDGGACIINVIARKNGPDLSRAIVQTMSKSSCHHEYDCCGCQLNSARVLHRHGRRYVVRLSTYYNY